MTSVSRPEGLTRSTYDAVGRLTEISEPAGSITFTYDAVDRLVGEVQITEAQRTEIVYAYDALDRRISRTVNGVPGETTTFGYDRASRLTSIGYRGETTTFEYDPAGRLLAKTLPNGIRQELTYDDANRLVAIRHATPDGATIDTIAYTYDANGRRIAQASGRNALSDTAFTAVYDTADRLVVLTLTDTGQTFDLTYDENGNLARRASRNDPANVTTYSWDSRNRLIDLSGPGVQATFAYDSLGRRLSRTLNGQRVDYVYDGVQAIGELTAGVPVTLLTGLGLDDVIARYTDAGGLYYLTDALKSVVAQTRFDRSIQNYYVYSPHGETISIGSDGGNPVQYTGRENDGTGLYYYRARYYDGQIGRFLSEDPAGFSADVNAYAYVNNEPTNLTDPLGLQASSWFGSLPPSPMAFWYWMNRPQPPVEVCCRPVDVNWFTKLVGTFVPPARHCFVKTTSTSGGMGPADGGPLPAWPFGIPTKIIPHDGQESSATCEPVPNAREECVNEILRSGKSTGPWGLFNQCHTVADDIVNQCGGSR